MEFEKKAKISLAEASRLSDQAAKAFFDKRLDIINVAVVPQILELGIWNFFRVNQVLHRFQDAIKELTIGIPDDLTLSGFLNDSMPRDKGYVDWQSLETFDEELKLRTEIDRRSKNIARFIKVHWRKT